MSMSSCGVSKPAGARPTRTADQIREALKSRCNSYLLTQWKERHHLLKGNSDQFHSALKAEMTSRLVDGMLPLNDDAPFVYARKEEDESFLDGKRILRYETQSCGGKGQTIRVPITE